LEKNRFKALRVTVQVRDMTVFSATDAAFEGFRVTWEKPRTLLIWTGFFLVVNLLMPLALFGLGLGNATSLPPMTR
jgi:hypothetical protein